MKTAISLPDHLFRAAERSARRMGLSRSELYRRALESFICEREARKVTEALDRIYETEPAPAGLDPVLEALQSASIPDDPW